MGTAPRLRRRLAVAVAALAALAVVAVMAWVFQGRLALSAAERRFAERVATPAIPADDEPLVGAEDNSATWLQRGAQDIDLSDRRETLELAGRPATTWDEQERLAARSAIGVNIEALKLLRHSLDFDSGRLGIDWDSGGAEGQRRTVRMIEAAKLVAVAGRLAAFEQRASDSATAVEILGRLAEVLAAERDVLAVLGSLAVERLQLAVVHDLASGKMIDAVTLERLASAEVDTDPELRLRWSLGLEATRLREFDCARTDRGLIEGWRCRLAAGRDRASALDLLASLAPDADRPFVGSVVDDPPNVPAASDEGAERPALLNLRSATGRVAAVSSLRQLAKIALAARAGAVAEGHYPAELAEFAAAAGPDPLTGQSIEVAPSDDGGLVLSIPDAERVVGRILSNPDLVPYRWTLPAANNFSGSIPTTAPRPGV